MMIEMIVTASIFHTIIEETDEEGNVTRKFTCECCV